MQEKNDANAFVIAPLVMFTSLVLFLLRILDVIPSSTEMIWYVGLLSDVANFSITLLYLVAPKSWDIIYRLNPHISSTSIIGFVLVLSTSIFMFSTAGKEPTFILYILLLGLGLLLHGHLKPTILYLVSMFLISGMFLLYGGYPLASTLTQMISGATLAIIVRVSNHRRDLQDHKLLLSQEELEVSNQMLTEAKQQIEKNQIEIIQKARVSSLMHLSSGVAHEINNPLSIISGASRLIRKIEKKGNLDHETVQKYTDKIEANAQRIVKIVSSLQTFSSIVKAEKGTKVNMEDLVATLEPLVGYNKSYSPYVLGINIPNIVEPDGLVPIEAIQILEILIKNASDSIMDNKDSWITLNVYQDDTGLVFQVIDSGPGVAAEHEECIFDPFFTTKQVGQGKGLGLSDARGLAQRIGAEIEYNPYAPHTTFELRFRSMRLLAA